MGAVAAYLNSISVLVSAETMVPALTGLIVSIVVYLVAYAVLPKHDAA